MQGCQTHPELFDLGLDVTLGEVLDVGELQVHLGQPHQDGVSGRLKLFPLTDKVLHIGKGERKNQYPALG